MKIAFVGLPCSGKTTTAKILARELNATFVPEVARLVIESRGKPPTQNDQNFIMRMQSALENTAQTQHIVCDVPVFVNLVYYEHYFGETSEWHELFQIASAHEYDLIFKLSPLPYKEDGVRYQTEDDLVKLDKLMDEFQPQFGRFVEVSPKGRSVRMELIIEEVNRWMRNSGKN